MSVSNGILSLTSCAAAATFFRSAWHHRELAEVIQELAEEVRSNELKQELGQARVGCLFLTYALGGFGVLASVLAGSSLYGLVRKVDVISASPKFLKILSLFTFIPTLTGLAALPFCIGGKFFAKLQQDKWNIQDITAQFYEDQILNDLAD